MGHKIVLWLSRHGARISRTTLGVLQYEMRKVEAHTSFSR